MRKITAYIFQQCFLTLVLVASGLLIAIWLSQALRQIDFVINRGLPALVFFELTVLLTPPLLQIVLPIALFSAVLFTYNRLTGESELVVLRAAGLSHSDLARPALMLAVACTAMMYLLSLYLSPLAFRNFEDLRNEMKNSYADILLEEGTFKEVYSGFTVYVRERAGEGELRGLLVDDSRDPEKRETMMAEAGSIVQTPAGTRLVLVQGNRQTVSRDPETGQVQQLAILYFDQYTVDLEFEKEEGYSRWRESEERFLGELLFPEGTTDDLNNIERFRAEAVHRMLHPLYALVFTLVALTAILSGEYSRRGQAKRIVGAILVVILLQSLALGAQNVATRNGAMLPLMVANALVPFFACLYLMRHRMTRRRAAEAPDADDGPGDAGDAAGEAQPAPS